MAETRLGLWASRVSAELPVWLLLGSFYEELFELVLYRPPTVHQTLREKGVWFFRVVLRLGQILVKTR